MQFQAVLSVKLSAIELYVKAIHIAFSTNTMRKMVYGREPDDPILHCIDLKSCINWVTKDKYFTNRESDI